MSKSPIGKIICVFNPKGGVGKTTTSCQLAGTFGHRGYDVLVADLDEQSSASKWVSRAGGNRDIYPASLWTGHFYNGNIASELGQLAGKYDLIIVDCAPATKQPGTWASLLVSDLALIPTKLGPSDTDALAEAYMLAKQARRESGVDFPVRVLPVAYRKSRADDKQALEGLANNTEYLDMPPTLVTLGDRVAFTRSMLYGATVHSMPKANDAINEIDALADEIAALIGIPPRKGK